MGYWQQPLGEYREEHLEDDSMNQGYDDGYALGKAFAALFQVRTTEISKIISVAQKFSKWEGYRELESGMEYIRGFVDGFSSEQLKQNRIASAVKEDAQ